MNPTDFCNRSIIHTILIWVTGFNLVSLYALLGGYALSQVILTLTAILKRKTFEIFYRGTKLQDELASGNAAVALRFAGLKIGTAFAIATAAQIVVYDVYNLGQIMMAWFAASVIAVIAWKVLSFIAEKIILWRIDVQSEVLEQRNIAIGALQAVIYISIGLLLSSL